MQPIAAPHGSPHVLVTFAIEDGGRLRAHAFALYEAVAITVLRSGRTPYAGIRNVDAPTPC